MIKKYNILLERNSHNLLCLFYFYFFKVIFYTYNYRTLIERDKKLYNINKIILRKI